jgi:hypothetical protein
MNRFQGSALLMTIVLALSSAAFPQASSSSLQGTVTDPTGSAIAGAAVTLSDNDSRIERSATTDAQGEYRFLALPPGTYSLSVNAKGFTRYVQTKLQLLVNTPTTSNVQLKIGSNTESVTVTSEAPALNLVDASIGNPFNETQVKQIPLEGRNVPDLLNLQAGVAYTGNRSDNETPTVKDQDSRSGSVNGARSDQSNITLDGVDVNDQSHGYAFTSVLPVTLDSVQEFRVTTSNYNSDQGGGSGAQVSLVTKSGTNKFHGSLYEYNRNTFTSASDYLLQQPLKLIRNIFGVSVGGPIQKDRLFFFTNYEGTRRREATSAVRSIPTPSLCAGNLSYYAYANNDPTQPVVTQTLSASDLTSLDPWTGPTPVSIRRSKTQARPAISTPRSAAGSSPLTIHPWVMVSTIPATVSPLPSRTTTTRSSFVLTTTSPPTANTLCFGGADYRTNTTPKSHSCPALLP